MTDEVLTDEVTTMKHVPLFLVILLCGACAAFTKAPAPEPQPQTITEPLGYIDPKAETILRELSQRNKKLKNIRFTVMDTMDVVIETGEKIQTQPWQIRSEYQSNIQHFIKQYKLECRQHRIDYVPIDTSEDYDKALYNYLIMRKRI